MTFAVDAKIPRLEKRSWEDKNHDFDLSKIMPTGVALVSATIAQAAKQGNVTGSTNLTMGSTSVSGQRAQAKIGGGTHGEDYYLLCQATDANGGKHEGAGVLEIRDR